MKNGGAIQKSSSNLDTEIWNAETVATVIKAKMQKINIKNKVMNCFVLQCENPITKDNEVGKFINALKLSIEKNNFNAADDRFQLMVQRGAHWTPLDITVKDSRLHIISIDSIGSFEEMLLLLNFKLNFPSASIYMYNAIENEGGVQIQEDNCSCSRFSLDILFKLRNIDALGAIQENIPKTNPKSVPQLQKDHGPHYVLAPKDIPTAMAIIFRNVQSWDAIHKLPSNIQSALINKSGESLKDYITRHAGTEEDGGEESKKPLRSINIVKDHMKDYTQNYLTNNKNVSPGVEFENAVHYISQNKAERDKINLSQTERFTPEQKMCSALSKFLEKNPVEQKSVFAKMLPDSKKDKQIKTAKKLVSDLDSNKNSDKIQRTFSTLSIKPQNRKK